ncbi:MAG: urea ABC transporter permease subunit UrtB [Vulcanimicrobiaceae bacterium]
MEGSFLLNQFTDGLSVIAILALVAIGLTIIFGVMGVINLAHGEFLMLGAYSAYVTETALHADLLLAIPIAFVVSALVGFACERIVIRHLYGRPLETLLATFGIALILQQLVRFAFSARLLYVRQPRLFGGSFTLGPLHLSGYRTFVIVLALAVVGGVFALVTRSRFGLALRAVVANREMASCLGIDTRRIDTFAFALGAGLAGIAGAVVAPLKSVSPTMGTTYIVDAFMVVVVGGVGNVLGALAGGTLVGGSETILGIFASPVIAKILVLCTVLVLLRLRPGGLITSKRR